jgi:hypothetical protein
MEEEDDELKGLVLPSSSALIESEHSARQPKKILEMKKRPNIP